MRLAVQRRGLPKPCQVTRPLRWLAHRHGSIWARPTSSRSASASSTPARSQTSATGCTGETRCGFRRLHSVQEVIRRVVPVTGFPKAPHRTATASTAKKQPEPGRTRYARRAEQRSRSSLAARSRVSGPSPRPHEAGVLRYPMSALPMDQDEQASKALTLFCLPL